VFLVHNERTKLTAAWINTLATALIAAGAFAPAAAFMYGFSALPFGPGYLFLLPLVCIAVGVAIHLTAWRFLGRLRE
jgi:hypothetical protein